VLADIDQRFQDAVQAFWDARDHQQQKQVDAGRIDAGTRGAVTGGTQMSALEALLTDILVAAGLSRSDIRARTALELPGYYRPEKKWDLLVVADSQLLVAVEFKSQVGPSFGNNFNNRVEEALGNATDFWTAYKKGVFNPSQRPWLVYLFMLQEHEQSVRPTKRTTLRPFGMDETFQELSYAQRYEKVCERLVRELLYDAACFFTSNQHEGLKGRYSEPSEELAIRKFAISLHARAAAFTKIRR